MHNATEIDDPNVQYDLHHIKYIETKNHVFFCGFLHVYQEA